MVPACITPPLRQWRRRCEKVRSRSETPLRCWRILGTREYHSLAVYHPSSTPHHLQPTTYYLPLPSTSHNPAPTSHTIPPSTGRCKQVVTCFPLPITHYLQPTTHYHHQPATSYPQFSTHLPTTHSLPPSSHCLPFIYHHPLPTYNLPSAKYRHSVA